MERNYYQFLCSLTLSHPKICQDQKDALFVQVAARILAETMELFGHYVFFFKSKTKSLFFNQLCSSFPDAEYIIRNKL